MNDDVLMFDVSDLDMNTIPDDHRIYMVPKIMRNNSISLQKEKTNSNNVSIACLHIVNEMASSTQ